MDKRHHFGKWTDTEGRIEELYLRLAAWGLSEDRAHPIWEDAFRRFNEATDAVEDPFALSPKVLLECFEEALHTADHFADELRGLCKGDGS